MVPTLGTRPCQRDLPSFYRPGAAPKSSEGKRNAVTIDTLTPLNETAPLRARSDQPDETRYVHFLVGLMRTVVAFIVAGFIIGGIGMGFAHGHSKDRSIQWVDGECTSTVNADGTCGYKPAAGAVLAWSIGGGTAGLLGGLVATFGIETGIVVYLAARKYLRG
jgi:hypothetical protein